MSAGQPTAQAGIGQTVVPYATLQEAFQKDPGKVHDAARSVRNDQMDRPVRVGLRKAMRRNDRRE